MSWRTVTLGEFLKVRQDRFKPKDEALQGLKRVDKIDFSGNIYLSNKGSNTDMILVKHGDLLISGINVEKGAVAVYDGQEDVAATIHYSSYEFDNEKIDIEFLKLFLKSPEFLAAIKEQVPGGIKTEIKPKHLLPLEVIIPELDDQKEVIKNFKLFHSKQRSISTELNHQLALVNELRQAYLREAMQGKLARQNATDEPVEILLEKIKAEKEKLATEKRIKRTKLLPPIKPEEIPFEIPSNWTWCKFQDITTVITCGMASTPRYYQDGRMFLSAKNVKPFRFMPNEHKFVDEETYKKIIQNAKPEINDILITRVGAGIGETALIDVDIDFAYYVSLTLVKPIKNHINSKFLVFWLNSPKGIQSAITYTTGTGSSQGNLNVEKVRGFLIPLPPLAEQERIAAKLETLMKFCATLEANIRQGIANADILLQTELKEALQPKEINR